MMSGTTTYKAEDIDALEAVSQSELEALQERRQQLAPEARRDKVGLADDEHGRLS
jgi:hypothetical protein